MICGKIVSRQHQIVGERSDGYLAECILPDNHGGYHVIKTPEGQHFAWHDDWVCDCEDCRSDDPDAWCYVFWKMSDSEVAKLL